MATLLEIKSYMSDRKRASLYDIAIGLGTSTEAAKALLEVWAGKRRVRQVPSDCGGTCGKSCCDSKNPASEVYEWIDREVAS